MGKYTKLADAYLSVIEALNHGGAHHGGRGRLGVEHGLSGQAGLVLSPCIQGGRTLAGDPAAEFFVCLPVSYQYHQRHGASFL